MNVRPIKTRIFKEKENIVSFIIEHIKRIPDGAVLAVTSKIVALSEGRVANIAEDDEEAREKIIKAESQWAIKTKWTWLTMRDNTIMTSAGIDRSNANGKTILLPKDSYVAASKIRKALLKHYKLKKLGIVITDSRLFPLRAGITAVATGYAGFKGIQNNKGEKDIFGREMKFARADVADSLATAAVLVMGETNQQKPLAVITGAPVEYRERVDRKELQIDWRDDLYWPAFTKLGSIRVKKGKNPYNKKVLRNNISKL